MEEITTQSLIRELSTKTTSKIIMLIIDGIGGFFGEKKSELESAETKNLNSLAKISSCGLIQPVLPGITPGSGPSHLALFGYDPIKYQIGRGVLEALGIDFPLKNDDIAARGNLATIDKDGIVIDRRAGRISTEKNIEICKLLDTMKIDNVEILVKPVKEHRVTVIFRGANLDDSISDADPQKEGLPFKSVTPLSDKPEKTANIINKFLYKVREILISYYPANFLLLRGFSKHPNIPSMSEIFKLTPAAIAVYPMYKGLARLVGMKILESGNTIADEIKTLKNSYKDYNFFYVHIKATDSAGEDGNYEKKVKTIEEVDSYIPEFMEFQSDVFIVTGDHSTPSPLKSHSWHPVPFLLHSKYSSSVKIKSFCERECLKGSLGIFPTINVMTLAMAHSLKLKKFGA